LFPERLSAALFADFLADHPRVADVKYLGRATGSQAEIVARQMHGAGGILSFLVNGDAAQTAAVVDRPRLITLARASGASRASPASRSPSRTTP
jgi:cystathionine gamma-synthase/methionine-gamma-lyase